MRGRKDGVQVESSHRHDEQPEMEEREHWVESKKGEKRKILKGRGEGGVWIIAFHLDNHSIQESSKQNFTRPSPSLPIASKKSTKRGQKCRSLDWGYFPFRAVMRERYLHSRVCGKSLHGDTVTTNFIPAADFSLSRNTSFSVRSSTSHESQAVRNLRQSVLELEPQGHPLHQEPHVARWQTNIVLFLLCLFLLLLLLLLFLAKSQRNIYFKFCFSKIIKGNIYIKMETISK